MRITLLTYAYAPSLGGLEAVTRLVADGLQERGHQIRIVTMTSGLAEDESRVFRKPSIPNLIRHLAWGDAVVQSNVSLRLAWPLWLGVLRKPWIVVNHTPVSRSDSARRMVDKIKLRSLPPSTYSVSHYLVRETLPVRTKFIRNPYDDSVFTFQNTVSEPGKKLLFVGRLAHAKGVDLLLRALSKLLDQDDAWTLTIVGDGELYPAIANHVLELNLGSNVHMLGKLAGPALAEVMRSHSTLVVPSRSAPPEAFGIVALEAIASGCAVVASDSGGLPEAVGQSGLIFPTDDIEGLAIALHESRRFHQATEVRRQHVARHSVATVARDYEQAIFDEIERREI